MWIQAGWLQILQFCIFTALTVSHTGSLGGGNNRDLPAQPRSALGGSCTTRRALCPRQRTPPATPEQGVDFHREDCRAQHPPCLPQSRFRQLSGRHFAFQDIWFSTHFIAAHFTFPDLNFRNCNWHQPSLASGLHSSFVKSRYSVHTAEAQTSKKKKGSHYLPSADCHSNALWVSSIEMDYTSRLS